MRVFPGEPCKNGPHSPTLFLISQPSKTITQNMTCNSSCNNSFGLLILRLSTGGLLLFHGGPNFSAVSVSFRGCSPRKGSPVFWPTAP